MEVGREVKLTPFRFPQEERDMLEIFAAADETSMNNFVIQATRERCKRLMKQKTFKGKLVDALKARGKSLRQMEELL